MDKKNHEYETYTSDGRKYYSERPVRCSRCHFYLSDCGCVLGEKHCYYIAPNDAESYMCFKKDAKGLLTKPQQKNCSHCCYHRPQFRYRVCLFSVCPRKRSFTPFRHQPLDSESVVGVMRPEMFKNIRQPTKWKKSRKEKEAGNDQVFSIWKQG